MNREDGLAALRAARAARFDTKAIRESKKESRRPPSSLMGKSANQVLADLQEELKDNSHYDCACLLAASPKPKHVGQAIAIFETLIKKPFRVADCRRQLGNLCLLEGRYREAAEWLSHPSLLSSSVGAPPVVASPPWIAAMSKELIYDDVAINARDLLKWSLELEEEARTKLIQEFKTKYWAEFNPKQLISAKTNYQRHPSDQAAFAFATQLAYATMEQHQNEALSLFEALANRGYRKGMCQGRRGLLHFMADRLELAMSFLQASLNEKGTEVLQKEARTLSPSRRKESLCRLDEEEAFKITVKTVLDWATETMKACERSDPQKAMEREAREQQAELERLNSLDLKKRREITRQTWLKQEADRAEKIKVYEAKLRADKLSNEDVIRGVEDILSLESAKAAATRAFVAKNALIVATAQVAAAKHATIEPQKLADIAAAQVARARLEAAPIARPMQHESSQDRMAREAQERLLSMRRSRAKPEQSSSLAEQEMAQAITALEKAEAALRGARQQVDDCIEVERLARVALEQAEDDLRFRLGFFSTDQVPLITAAQTAVQVAATAAAAACKWSARAAASAESAENAAALVAAAAGKPRSIPRVTAPPPRKASMLDVTVSPPPVSTPPKVAPLPVIPAATPTVAPAPAPTRTPTLVTPAPTPAPASPPTVTPTPTTASPTPAPPIPTPPPRASITSPPRTSITAPPPRNSITSPPPPRASITSPTPTLTAPSVSPPPKAAPPTVTPPPASSSHSHSLGSTISHAISSLFTASHSTTSHPDTTTDSTTSHTTTTSHETTTSHTATTASPAVSASTATASHATTSNSTASHRNSIATAHSTPSPAATHAAPTPASRSSSPPPPPRANEVFTAKASGAILDDIFGIDSASTTTATSTASATATTATAAAGAAKKPPAFLRARSPSSRSLNQPASSFTFNKTPSKPSSTSSSTLKPASPLAARTSPRNVGSSTTTTTATATATAAAAAKPPVGRLPISTSTTATAAAPSTTSATKPTVSASSGFVVKPPVSPTKPLGSVTRPVVATKPPLSPVKPSTAANSTLKPPAPVRTPSVSPARTPTTPTRSPAASPSPLSRTGTAARSTPPTTPKLPTTPTAPAGKTAPAKGPATTASCPVSILAEIFDEKQPASRVRTTTSRAASPKPRRPGF